MNELPSWAREKLPKHITYIKYPIEVGNGDWAIGIIKNWTILYSRYPFLGNDGLNKQRNFKWRGRLDKFTPEDWDRFIRAVARWAKRTVPREAATLVGYLSQLRVRRME